MDVNRKMTNDNQQQQQQEDVVVNLITFDLDDTIFPIGPVVKEANEKLIQTMESLGYDQTKAADIITSTKIIRSKLAVDDIVVTYTELRKRAIRREMEKHHHNNNNNDKEGMTKVTNAIVDEVYNAWELERHAAAERHLYKDTIPMLQSLKANHPSACIGAITNGKGNPLHMKETVATYFDFCVSGEDEDVFPYRKPDVGIYNAALKRYLDIVGSTTTSSSSNDNDDDDNDESFTWFHVGDDLANDVGASASCGAKAIWVDLSEEYGQTASKRTTVTTTGATTTTTTTDGDNNQKTVTTIEQQQQPAWSTASKEELEKRRLLNERAQEYVSERVETLLDLPNAISKLLVSQ